MDEEIICFRFEDGISNKDFIELKTMVLDKFKHKYVISEVKFIEEELQYESGD